MADQFETVWEEYEKAYKETNSQIFFDDMQLELERRIGQ